MKINENILLQLPKIKQANHKTMKDYLDQFMVFLEKMSTLFVDSIQISSLKYDLLPSIR